MKRMLSLLMAVLITLTVLPSTALAAQRSADQNVFLLPGSLTSIEAEAFSGNEELNTVIIPNTVTSIGAGAFRDCTGLTAVTIGGRDITIADDAFEGCGSQVVFYAHSDSKAMLWALAHGYEWETLDDGSEHFKRFSELVAHSGFNPSLLQSGMFASGCLIVRTGSGVNHLPDISMYSPTDIFKSDDNLYYVQFEDADTAEECYNYLDGKGIQVEPDRVCESASVSAQGVTIAENWGTNDVMGFDEYAPYVAARSSGSVTIAVIDSGVTKSAWNGKFSASARSLVGGDAYTDSLRHGSKVASIISDCMGDNVTKTTLLPIRVVSSASTYRTSVIIEGIKHAVSSGANLINMSLGWDISEGRSPEIERQLSAASGRGVLVVGAGGNGSGSVMYPASLGSVIAVSALTYSQASGYKVSSRTGSEIDYTAPGIHLKTTAYPNVDAAGDALGYASTSFAAPQITAALALIRLDNTKAGRSATAVLDSCCKDLAAEGVTSSAFGRGLPQLEKLAVIGTSDIVLRNMAGDDIPTRLWLGDKQNDLLLGWELVPANASAKTITASVSDPDVLNIRQYGNTSALITAAGVGEAIVTVTNGQVEKNITITVEQPVTELVITGCDGTMIVGKKLQLAVGVRPANATSKAYEWKSSNTAVAIVSKDGVVTALKTGQVTVSCEALDGYGTVGSVDINVIEVPDAESLLLSAVDRDVVNKTVTAQVGETFTLDAVITPESAPQDAYYSAYPAGILQVSDNGVVNVTGPGTATIVATATTGRNVTDYLTVKAVILPVSLTVSADRTVLDIGDTTAVTAVIKPSNATETNVTWTSRNTAVAKVNASTGLVTAIAAGTAEITGTTSNGKKASVTVTVRQPITVTFNANGGTADEAERDAYSGYAIGELPNASRTYWKLLGWYTAKTGGSKATADSAFTADTTLYAHWQGLPYTVTFDANTGACEQATMQARVGAKLGSLPTATKDYYAFLGWFTAAADGSEVTPDYVQSTDAALTVYAHWAANSYTMTFNTNGGSCDTATRVCHVDTAIGTLPAATREYYTFKGWYTARTGGKKVTSAYQQATDANITLYAHWEPKTYKMTFDPNGGACETATADYPVDTDVGTLPVPTRDYYTFAGWYIEGDTSVHVTDTYRQATTADVTVTARWIPGTYQVTLDANGGDCATATLTGKVDTALGALPTPTRTYYTFKGWYTAKTGGTEVTAAYQQATDTAITIFAHWTPVQYDVIFNANGGSLNFAGMSVPVGEAIGTLPTPSRSYYTFDGWYTAKSGGTQITGDYVQYTNSLLQLYAHWIPGTYTVTYDANGGSVSPATATGTVDTALGTLPVPTRSYYTFNGWYTAKTGGSKVDTAYTQANTTALTLYARWTPMTYTMQFYANGDGANTPVSAKTFSVDTAVGTLPVPTRDYYNFAGWYTDATSGSLISESYKHPNTTTLKVYAHWTLKPESGWVLPANVPENAQVTQTSWSYREDTESTSSTMSGWTANGTGWKQTATGSAEYASFPSGEYDTGNKYYKEMMHAPYESKTTDTTKREVTNSSAPTGYIYWHWAINGTYSPTAKRIIAYKKGTYSDGYWYGYFYAIKSTTKCPKASSDYCTIGQYPSNGRTTYNCTTLINNTSLVPAADKTSSTSGLKTYRFYELPYYTSTYTDYVKTYKYYRNVSYSLTEPSGSNISNKVKYVKYRLK